MGGQRGVGGLQERLVQAGVVGHDRGLHERGVPRREVPLRQLAVGEVPVPGEFVRQRSGQAGQVHGHRGVLQHRQVTDLEDVP